MYLAGSSNNLESKAVGQTPEQIAKNNIDTCIKNFKKKNLDCATILRNEFNVMTARVATRNDRVNQKKNECKILKGAARTQCRNEQESLTSALLSAQKRLTRIRDILEKNSVPLSVSVSSPGPSNQNPSNQNPSNQNRDPSEETSDDWSGDTRNSCPYTQNKNYVPESPEYRIITGEQFCATKTQNCCTRDGETNSCTAPMMQEIATNKAQPELTVLVPNEISCPEQQPEQVLPCCNDPTYQVREPYSRCLNVPGENPNVWACSLLRIETRKLNCCSDPQATNYDSACQEKNTHLYCSKLLVTDTIDV
jgi:hypothetical protein